MSSRATSRDLLLIVAIVMRNRFLGAGKPLLEMTKTSIVITQNRKRKGENMIKLTDIARHLGVSVSTVSYSLNNDPRIPAATKQRVLDAAAKLGYVGKSGRNVNGDYLKQIVLCINSLAGDIYNTLAEAMKEILELNNCILTVYIGADISRIKWMDGLFVLNSRATNEDIAKVLARRIPVVLMDRETTIPDAANITLDNFDGCKQVTQCAIDAGARSFAFIGGPRESYESRYRFDGFCRALEINGLPHKKGLVLQTDFTYDGGLNACRFVLEHAGIPDAIICANDETAMGILAGLKKENVKKDVIVTGFDGIIPYSLPYRFVTAKADHKYWATTASYSLLQLFEQASTHAFKKIPVKITEYNM